MDIMAPAEIMDKAFDILRENIKTIVLYSIGFSIITFFLILLAVLLGSFTAAFSAAGGTFDFLVVILGFLLFSLLGAFYFAFGVGIIKISAQDILDYKIYAHQVIKFALKSIYKVFKIIIAGVLISLPPGVALLTLGYFIISLLEKGFAFFPAPGAASGVQQILAVLFFIILGAAAAFLIIAYIALFCFTFQAAFIEKRGAVDSIKRSFKLVTSDFKSIYGYFILFSLIPLAIGASLQGIITLITGFVFLIMNLFNMQMDYIAFMTSAYAYSRVPYNITYWLVISHINSIMMTILYFNTRYKLEGYDIMLKLKKLQGEFKEGEPKE